MKYKVLIILTIFILAPLIVNEWSALAAQEPVTATAEPAILAPQGLADKEQAQLEQQYRYTFRDKGAILSPYQETDTYSQGELERAQNEQEKLYRYFGAANTLYKEGRLEEAAKILKYIAEKNPDDEYVKHFYDKVLEELRYKKKQWKAQMESDARFLREQRVKSLIREGIDHYEQKRFDDALLNFADVLAIEPDNDRAKGYMEKLKGYYKKEVEIQDLVESSDVSRADQISPQNVACREEGKGAVERLLNTQEGMAAEPLNNADKGISSAAHTLLEKKETSIKEAAERMLGAKEMDNIVTNKRMKKILDEANFQSTIEEIIKSKKEAERRDRTYTLGPGDTIQISVRNHSELSGSSVIRVEGGVVLPLVNDLVKISGLTVDEATKVVTKEIARYVKDPYVTIAIEQYKSKTFYVIDENGCTPYPVARANLTLRDALFVSDWGDRRALGRVIVMKPHRVHPIVRKINAYDIIFHGNLANNIRIDDGDVIYVPMITAAKISKTIGDILSPVAAVKNARDTWLNMKGDTKSYKEWPKVRGDAREHYNLFQGESFPTLTLVQ